MFKLWRDISSSPRGSLWPGLPAAQNFPAGFTHIFLEQGYSKLRSRASKERFLAISVGISFPTFLSVRTDKT